MKRRGRIRPVKEYVSPDLCREILCRLPVKDLLRFRLVCKTWCSIIDDPQFVSLHLTRYKNNVEGSRLLVLEWQRRQFCLIIRRSDTFRKIGVSDGSLVNGFSQYNSLDIAGYVNGLFVLWYGYKNCTIMVLNPSIRRQCTLPPSPKSNYNRISLGFGFDHTNNDYKIVAVCQKFSGSDYLSLTTVVYLYTFGGGSWKVISGDHRFPWFNKNNVFIEGIIYWVTLSDVFSFDVGREMFSRCNVPDYGSTFYVETIPVIFGESLALLSSASDHYDLWVRDQYANWIKLHTIHEVDPGSFMSVKMNGDMLFNTDKGVCSYNMNTHEMKVVAKHYRRYKPPFKYVESLVWPMGF